MIQHLEKVLHLKFQIKFKTKISCQGVGTRPLLIRSLSLENQKIKKKCANLDKTIFR